MSEIKFDYDDILVIPDVLTDISSRYDDTQVNPFHFIKTFFQTEQLPLFTAPMDTVVDGKNISLFKKNKIGVVLPRTMNMRYRLPDTFNSFGLSDKPENLIGSNYVLLDVANGHMKGVLQWCEKLKGLSPNTLIMAGNIANPRTFTEYHKSGVIDYARIGIGNGNGCLTTQQTGVGYPMGSLVRECFMEKHRCNSKMNIVADGGIKKYSDIIKALALGADYVMIGGLFSKAIESAAPNYFKGFKISEAQAIWLFKKGYSVDKIFRGMSTKGAQKALGNVKFKTSEGVTRKFKAEYTIEKWVENFESYLRSTMSYTNSKTLSDFIGKADYVHISQNSFNRFNK